ncbi:MAG: anaerobic ribonucleoside-triphosphate reductase activating protein [Alphaproteobacteria bacterium]|nr:anaerobic ribonucleoside-triphosphate reductase activating protein [Alphaproteobacteria bacterium]
MRSRREIDYPEAPSFSTEARTDGATPLATRTHNSNSNPQLRVGGLTKFTTIDFPGKLAAVVYCRGCSLRCHYCHNPELQTPRSQPGDLSWKAVLDFLESRKGRLEGVAFCGGEPLVQKALPDAMRDVRAMGLEVALHTSGMNPVRFAEILPLVDWVGFDIKTKFEDYQRVTQVRGSGAKARESFELLLESGIAYETRTTCDPDLIPPSTLIVMAGELRDMGVKTFRLQESSARMRNYDASTENEIATMFPDFEIRRNPLSVRKAA